MQTQEEMAAEISSLRRQVAALQEYGTVQVLARRAMRMERDGAMSTLLKMVGLFHGPARLGVAVFLEHKVSVDVGENGELLLLPVRPA